jgi:hypothetical protein
MMKGYAARYPAEEFEVVALEHVFEGPILNPATGASSRSFRLAGKVDGIVRIDREYFILEHKTASQIDSDYLERLWTDFQITLYAHYVEQTMGLPVTGILYNVLVKARLQQSKGETEEEFEARRAELLAKSKTGRTAARRREPESDEDFQRRLAEKYADPAMFHRERLYLSRERFDIRTQLHHLHQVDDRQPVQTLHLAGRLCHEQDPVLGGQVARCGVRNLQVIPRRRHRQKHVAEPAGQAAPAELPHAARQNLFDRARESHRGGEFFSHHAAIDDPLPQPDLWHMHRALLGTSNVGALAQGVPHARLPEHIFPVHLSAGVTLYGTGKRTFSQDAQLHQMLEVFPRPLTHLVEAERSLAASAAAHNRTPDLSRRPQSSTP